MQLRSIQSKILLSFGIVVFTVIAAISLTFYYTISNTLTEDIRKQQLHTFIEAAQSDFTITFEKAIETSKVLASDPSLLKWFNEGETDDELKGHALNKLDAIVNEFGYFTIFAINGITNNYWTQGHQLSDVVSSDDPDDTWFFELMKGKQKVVNMIDFNRELNETALFIDVLMGDVNNPIGIAGVGLNPTEMIQELNKKRFSENSYMCIIDEFGKINLAQNANDVSKQVSEVISEQAAETILKSTDKGLISKHTINNEAFEIAYMNIGDTGHKTVLLVPTNELVIMLHPIRNFSFVIGIIFMIFALAMAYFISRSLANPILRLNQVVRNLSKGDLSTHIETSLTTRQDEIGQLAYTFEQMTSKISDVIIQAKQTASHISEGGTKLTKSANELSSRSMQQATSTEEVSASMEEMGANISQNADNSNQTEQLMSQAYKDTSNGGEIVKQAVDGIKLIAEKVQIIEEIAMQTNILSLNAAVEAARAGEEGRGFAVVAAEVRKLAERSRESANEISEKATTGVDIAIKAGEIFENLVPDIQKAYNLVADISAASLEQNEGSKQVNKAILELDNVSQGNAAAADNISALTDSFYKEITKLNDVIGFFKVKE
ncbi:methyl-accepting chemotaxis protein [Carboxylicivirga sp. M1479]|uniref:methyl-accepting chemotaxis protein n=1 Tax=Carboxylicivirga sp. M1479 TaxID=2594476 RepID=UPI0011779FAD|nr:methyl-accepting chemotaxis protein [Carboxylicivirga sp. M1479]TRX72441.1 HAMP domain-containing protein [Carboxylicivirga sp. M1479]